MSEDWPDARWTEAFLPPKVFHLTYKFFPYRIHTTWSKFDYLPGGKGGSMSREVNIDLSEYGIPKFQIKGLRWIVVGIFGLLFLFTFFYSVATEEVGVIQRFGAYP